jgi:D-alanyl-D-alanine dipeptidase
MTPRLADRASYGAPRRAPRSTALLAVLLGALLSACSSGAGLFPAATAAPTPAQLELLPGPSPEPAPERWLGLIGEYDSNRGTRFVLERGGRLVLADSAQHVMPLIERSPADFAIERGPTGRDESGSEHLTFVRDASGRAVSAHAGDLTLARRNIEPRPGTNQLRITPVRPVEALRAEALAASPPAEQRSARAADLVELTSLDPTIKLEVRYATTNNFLGTRFYDEARAFLQRPAAEAVVRAHQSLRPLGYGLLVHDAYRPWYVTKMFWDATPVDKRWLVANPATGSNHNRGAAVDLTLFDLASGQPVEMPSTYDESTDRAFATYPGGTSRQRWHRALLRRAMEAQGFVQNPKEWWHYDYASWRDYPIGNIPFDRIGR